MSQQPTYMVALVGKDEVDDIMNFLRRTFFLDEPLNKAVGLYESGSCPELEDYCMHSLLEGLSFKAVDSLGNIVGVLVNNVYPLKEDTGEDLLDKAEHCTNQKFQKILYILARREEGSKLWEMFPREQNMVEVMIAATDPAWRRRGIMGTLLRETEKATKERNIRILRMDTSSAYSAKAAERLGFTCVYKALYTDIKMDGRPLIVPEPPHVEDRVYIKTLFDRQQC